MNKGLKKLVAGVMTVASLAISVWGSGASVKTIAEGNDLIVKSAVNTVKIMQEEDISSLPEASVHIEAAKGETDGAQIVFRSDADILAYEITVSDLTAPNKKTIPATAVVPYVQLYTKVSSKTSTTFPNGYYPDALVPFSFIKAAKENFVKAGNNQGIWFDLKVPSDADAGVFTGTVTLLVDGQTITVPMTVKVYDFNMPSVPAVRTTYMIWQNWLVDGELDNSIDKYKDYYDTLLEYNATGYYFPAEIHDIDGFIACLREYYDKVAGFGIPYIPIGTSDYNGDCLNDYLTAILQASIEDGKDYASKAYYYFDKIYDEITEEKYGLLENIVKKTNGIEKAVADAAGSAAGKYAESIQNIKHVIPVVTGWQEEFAKYDELIISPIFDKFVSTKDIEDYKALIEQGYSIESYNSIYTWPYSSHQINDYLLTTRDVFWSKYEYGLNGDLIWNVNGYCVWAKPLSVGYQRVDDLWADNSRDLMNAGDGFLFYPGLKYKSDKPFPSLRLTALRDGIDDFTYLSELEKEYEILAAKYGVPNSARKIVTALNRQVFGTGVSKLNFDGLSDVRRCIAKLIVAAKTNGLMITDLTGGNSAVDVAFLSNSGYTAKINGSSVSPVTVEGGLSFHTQVPYSGSSLTLTLEGDNGMSVNLFTGKQPETVYTFDESVSSLAVNSAYNSSVALNTDAEFTRGGRNASAEVRLGGYKFNSDSQTFIYRPTVSFAISDVQNLQELRIWIYNPGDEIEIQVFAQNPIVTFTVNRIMLPANGWYEIIIDNFNYISAQPSEQQKINAIGISIANPVDGDEIGEHTFYIDTVEKVEK